ncbi:putative cyclic di-GMP phosphodiesterase [bioreactor metagenome]|uniref:Putative cyclic di-GMP phosphodiesterase n=1 Tax=bioreactor metagenome TaxID=1076179 RepID=A0A645H7W1_9ZZZZ
MLAAVSLFNDIAPIIEAHHERIDGGGYPRGLCGAEIPEESRIISVADAFDAMTSHRRYRENLSVAKAIEQLVEGKHEQFDANIVDVFIPILVDFDEIQRQLAWTYTGETD